MSTSTRILESEFGYVNDFVDGGSHGPHTRRAVSPFRCWLIHPSPSPGGPHFLQHVGHPLNSPDLLLQRQFERMRAVHGGVVQDFVSPPQCGLTLSKLRLRCKKLLARVGYLIHHSHL